MGPVRPPNVRIPSSLPTPSESDQWWLAVVAPFVLLGALSVLVLLVPRGAYPSDTVYVSLLRVLGASFVVSYLVGRLGLYFDIEYLSNHSDWTPSAAYVLMFFLPYLGRWSRSTISPSDAGTSARVESARRNSAGPADR